VLTYQLTEFLRTQTQQNAKVPVPQDLSASDDPKQIADFLIRDNGLDRARQNAVEGTTTANEKGDLYRLSVWREVKRILRDWTEDPE
jgi:hypothetical protein